MIANRVFSGFLVLLATNAPTGAGPPTHAPPLKSIVARMTGALAESRSRRRSYKVIRNYKLYGSEQQKVKSEVIADITFIPPDKEYYVIHKAKGVKGGVKLDHRGGEKLDHFTGGSGRGLKDLRGRLERRPATRFAGSV
jgi:hypothetical protein